MKFQEKENLLNNSNLDTLLNELPIEDSYAAILTSVIVNFFNNINQHIATDEILTNEQIITFVQNKEHDNANNNSEDLDKKPSEISIQEAYNALKTWLSFFEKQ
ncbi:3065_t:CDS:1 [Cetraspora pellucida]|uniref:3065_t:CDS:1 n=1 Tax=Cetraspora pellucida TaxID=1433469 RepID=A0A9N9NSV7_9GLOM|nr:3065_t:CDS:1 [Cetraspora pellucida]